MDLPVEDVELKNGALLQPIFQGCNVCEQRDEVVEQASHMLEKDSHQIWLCPAHTQELLNLNSDEIEKEEGGWKVFDPREYL